MTASRKRILKRAARALGTLLVGASAAAVVSDDFREFVGNETITAVFVALIPPALQTLGKWLRERKSEQAV